MSIRCYIFLFEDVEYDYTMPRPGFDMDKVDVIAEIRRVV
jgi:hypothetical protein